MIIKNELLDYTKPWTRPDVYLFTGNPICNAAGALVMGRGAAKQVRDTYPGVAFEFAKVITSRHNVQFVSVTPDHSQRIGWFKVKDHWKDPAKLDIIKDSASDLEALALVFPHVRYHMNAPGIGNGKLTWEEVEPLLRNLPDNVIIYKGD